MSDTIEKLRQNDYGKLGNFTQIIDIVNISMAGKHIGFYVDTDALREHISVNEIFQIVEQNDLQIQYKTILESAIEIDASEFAGIFYNIETICSCLYMELDLAGIKRLTIYHPKIDRESYSFYGS